MHVDLRVPTDNEEGKYLVACARIRDVTVTHLVRRLVNTVIKDQLVSAVLDDEGKRIRTKYHRHFKETV